MRLLLDEHISPVIISYLSDLGVFAQSVPHVGLTGRSDREVWRFAFEHDFAVVTTNARDFVGFLDVELHPGLIILRESGLSRQEQWERLKPVVEHVLATGDPDFLVNKLVEIIDAGQFVARDLPE